MAHFVKNENGGYFLVHDGFVYLNGKIINNRSGVWVCEEMLKNDASEQCKGKVKINDSNIIVQAVRHNHPITHKFARAKIFPTYKDKLSPENIRLSEKTEPIYHDGFKYKYKDYNNDASRMYYVCEKGRKCGGRAIIEKENGLVEVTIPHNHTGEKMLPGI